MKKVLCGAVVALAVTLIVDQLVARNLAEPKTIKEIMSEAHKEPEKDKPALCAKASKGVATKDEVKLMVTLYSDLDKNKPPQGDVDAFKKRASALVKATKKLAEDPTDKEAIAGYKKAVDCKSCHTAFRPAK